MTTGPTAVAPSKTEETYKERAAFCAHLYNERFFENSPVGEVARALHKNFLAYRTLRTRAAYSWPKHAAKWTDVDAAVLMKTWAEWRTKHG